MACSAHLKKSVQYRLREKFFQTDFKLSSQYCRLTLNFMIAAKWHCVTARRNNLTTAARHHCLVGEWTTAALQHCAMEQHGDGSTAALHCRVGARLR